MFSAIALLRDDERTALAASTVTFRELDPAAIDSYVATGEWRGRAGGYAIQGAGAALVTAIEGERSNVVGLPVAALLELWPELAVECNNAVSAPDPLRLQH